MSRDSTVIPFRQPDAIDDPLTELAREGARRMLAQALIAEADAFVSMVEGLEIAGWARPCGPSRPWATTHAAERRAFVREQGLQPLARDRCGVASFKRQRPVHAALRPNSLLNSPRLSLGVTMSICWPRGGGQRPYKRGQARPRDC